MPLVLWFWTTFPDTRDQKVDKDVTAPVGSVPLPVYLSYLPISTVDRENDLVF